jgi:phosphonate transport system permease protein
MPDMITYSFYRFECALRSSAILGFFGYPTLGFFIAASFENLHYGEVWTYLYTLFFLVTVVDWWSGALRKRFAV